MPFISVITINRNNAAGLQKTMLSVCAQDFKDLEYIVVDGASDDGSLQVVEANKGCVSHFISEKDKGIYDAMNKGIAKASGEYLLFLNSGDRFAESNVLTKMKAWSRGEDIVSGNILFEENGSNRRDFTPEKLSKLYLLHSMLYHPVTFIRKSLFDNFGLYDDNLRIVADYEFFLRVLSKSKISYRHLTCDVVIFDNSGVSAAAATRNQMLTERKAVQRKYFNSILLWAYYFLKSK
ncbi:MAG: glycosyltransferase family 2 protein [Bacteroidetes bacterium]|nr:glycosyltransferase family 2 protein [Bacteroidota bacterium]